MKYNCSRWVLALGMLLAGLAGHTQPGGWTVDSKTFQFSMSMVAQIETAGMPNQALNNHVAAFSGGQIRGYAKPVQIGGQAYYFMNLYANTYLGDKLYFMAFVGDVNKVFESVDTVEFLHHKQVGDILHPFILHFTLSPRPLIFSLSNINYAESSCTPGFVVDVEASDDMDTEGNGLKYQIAGGSDAARFKIDSITGVLQWKNFSPDFENPMDADGNNIYLVHVQVRDHAGNTFIQQLAVAVKDDPPPTATCPPAVTAKTSDDGPGDCSTTVSAGMQVGTPAGCATYQVSYALEGATTGMGAGQLPANQAFNSGKTTVRYTVTDEAGALSSSCSFTVTITDDEPMTATCPANQTADTAPGTCTATVLSTALNVSDNCAAGVQVSYTLSGAATGPGSGMVPGGQLFPAGVTTITYSAKEGAKAAQTCAFTVTVTDNELPQLGCPAGISTTLSSGCYKTLTGTAATASDNCGSPALAYALSGATTGSGGGQVPGGTKFQAGLTTVVYTATDSDGTGSNTCSYTVTVLETIKPTITCPVNTTITVGANCITALPDYRSAANVNDNCTLQAAISVVQQPAPAMVVNGLGTTTILLTASDLSGNSRGCTFNVTVEDNPILAITCPANEQVCDGVIDDYRALATILGGCSANAPVVTQDPMPNLTMPAYNSQVLITLTADNGVRSTNCTFTLTWKDTIPPTAKCKNANAVVLANKQASIAVADVDNGPSDNCGVQNVELSTTIFTCDNTGANVVTLTVTDIHGLTGTCTATVTVNDPNAYCCAAPDAICKANPSVALDAGGQVTVAAADIDNGSTYDCGLQSIVVSPNQFNCTHVSALQTVTLTVTDINGKSDHCQVGLAIQDKVKPLALCQNVTVELNSFGNGATTAAAVNDNSSDACGISTLALSKTGFTCVDLGSNTVTLTVTDNHSNTNSCWATVVVQDKLPPSITCPANLTLECASAANYYPPLINAWAATASAADNCSASVSNNYINTTPPTSCNLSSGLSVVFTATDLAGNSAQCTRTVYVQDTQKPVFTTVPPDLTVQCSAIPPVATPAASDGCDATVTIVYNGQTRTDGTCPDAYILTRLWTASDDCNNTRTATQRITVQDTEAPVFTNVPAAVTVECNAIPPVAAPNATDNCALAVSITYNGQTTTPGACPDAYTLTRKWTAVDNCGNTRTATQRITVQDTQKPNFTAVPANVTVQCNALPAVGTPAATDNCDASVSIAYNGQTRVDGNCPDTYTLTRQWTAVDNCGNTRTATQRINVVDITAPVFAFVPANVTVECDAIPPVGTPTATDNCDASVGITFNGPTIAPGPCPDTYTITRKWTAVDNCGNTRTATQRITVVDTKKPAFTFVPLPLTIQCSDPVPPVGTPAATDNCDASVTIALTGQITTNATCSNAYQIVRSWKATDNCGNWATASQVITVQDTQKPYFTVVPPHITIECSDLFPVTPGTAVASDNCDATVQVSFSGQSSVPGNCPQSYIVTRLWTAMDDCGNTVTATQTITVVDTHAPVFTNAPANITLSCTAPVPTVPVVTAGDACDNAPTVVYLGETSTGPNCPYTITRTWTVSDHCGNTRTHTQVISINAQGPPPMAPSEGASRLDGAVVDGRDRFGITNNTTSFRRLTSSDRGEGLFLRLMPNPAQAEAWVSFEAPTDGETTLQLCDAGGRLVLRQQFIAVSGVNSRRLDLSALPAGIYYVQVNVCGRVAVDKLIRF